jgi:hypothetical protein
LVWWQTLSLKCFKVDLKFEASPGSWLGFSSHLGHHLASSFHQNIDMSMTWSQLDWIQFDLDLVLLKIVSLLYSKARIINFLAGLRSWLGRYHKYDSS